MPIHTAQPCNCGIVGRVLCCCLSAFCCPGYPGGAASICGGMSKLHRKLALLVTLHIASSAIALLGSKLCATADYGVRQHCAAMGTSKSQVHDGSQVARLCCHLKGPCCSLQVTEVAGSMNTAISAYVGGLPLGVSISPYTEFPQAQTYINNTLSGSGASLPPQRRRKLMQGSASQQSTVSFLIAFQAGAPASAVADIQSTVASAIAPLTATISSVATGAGERCSCSAAERLVHATLLQHVQMLSFRVLPVASQSCRAMGCCWANTFILQHY